MLFQNFICNIWILCQIMFFSIISFSFICNVWMLYIYIYIYNEKCGRGVNCEEEMREKNEMGGGMYVCGGREEKRKAGGTWVVGKKKGNKKGKKKLGVGFTCMVGKNGEWKKKKKKILKGKKLN